MARDLPDWGAQSAQITVHEITDLGELAVRLGSIVSHDRRGDVVWIDDFECGIGKWEIFEDGTGADVTLSTAYGRNGECSAKLVAGSDAVKLAMIEHYIPLPVLGLLGAEISVYRASFTDYVQLLLGVMDGTTGMQATLRWVNSGGLLQYYNDTPEWVTIASGLALPSHEGLFHTFKLVMDAVNHVYVRVIVNGIEYPLDNLPLYVYPSAVGAHEYVTVTNYGRAANNDVIYVDDVILTQNEPPNS